MEFERGMWNCAVYGKTDQLLRLLKKGVNVNSQDRYGFTPLHYASRNGRTATCELLLSHGADVFAVTRNGKATALHRAAFCGHLDVVKLLCSCQKSEDYPPLASMLDVDGQTCLHSAARGNQPVVLHWLSITYPELISIRDNAGKTASDLLPL
ncbi:unnamed protein product [Mesocestoides corti]|nr:unnamed protein product [Mesocestoides corti]